MDPRVVIIMSLPLAVYVKRLPGEDDDSSRGSLIEDLDDCVLILKAVSCDRWFRATVSPDLVVQLGPMQLPVASFEFGEGTRLNAEDLGLNNLEEIDINCLKLSFASFPFQPTICPPALVNQAWVKRAKLECLVSKEALEYQMALLREEIIKCDGLMLHPHPNIAEYYGVVVEGSHIVGLAFKKYKQSVDEIKGVEYYCPSVESVYNDVKAGIEHLHSLGLVHNDIKPANICIDENGRAVIIDFDSATPTGQPLGLRGGTTGFCKEDMRISEEQNDMYSLRAVRAHLEFLWEGEITHY